MKYFNGWWSQLVRQEPYCYFDKELMVKLKYMAKVSWLASRRLGESPLKDSRK